jgi:hypothetical protein
MDRERPEPGGEQSQEQDGCPTRADAAGGFRLQESVLTVCGFVGFRIDRTIRTTEFEVNSRRIGRIDLIITIGRM